MLNKTLKLINFDKQTTNDLPKFEKNYIAENDYK